MGPATDLFFTTHSRQYSLRGCTAYAVALECIIIPPQTKHCAVRYGVVLRIKGRKAQARALLMKPYLLANFSLIITYYNNKRLTLPPDPPSLSGIASIRACDVHGTSHPSEPLSALSSSIT